MVWHVLSGWACVFWEMGLDELSKARAIEALPVYLKWDIPLCSSSWMSNMATEALRSISVITVCLSFSFTSNKQVCSQILVLPLTMYVTSDKVATWSLCFLCCKIGPNREQQHEVTMSIIMIEQAQCLALKRSHEVFVESNRVQEWKGNSTAWKTAFSFPNTSSCQSSLGHLGRGRKGIWTLKKSDRKPGIQSQETVGQPRRSKWEGCSLSQYNKGNTGSEMQAGGRRWQMLAHRALQRVDAQQPRASSFLMPSLRPTKLWREIKKGKEEREKKRTAAFLCDNNNTLSCWKTLNKLGIHGHFLNLMKGIHGQPTNSIILYGKILKAFPLRSRTRQSCLLLSLLFKNCTGGSDQGNKARKEIKGI